MNKITEITNKCYRGCSIYSVEKGRAVYLWGFPNHLWSDLRDPVSRFTTFGTYRIKDQLYIQEICGESSFFETPLGRGLLP